MLSTRISVTFALLLSAGINGKSLLHNPPSSRDILTAPQSRRVPGSFNAYSNLLGRWHFHYPSKT